MQAASPRVPVSLPIKQTATETHLQGDRKGQMKLRVSGAHGPVQMEP